jgi:4-amino-4-deoxy-L-arabinose transferase-like glycosyltransferase
MTRPRLILLFLLLSGLVFRTASLNDPVTYDEAYTYVGFASHGLWAALSDYSLPNNHVFHTVLVVFSTSLFGSHPWALRLPALLAGLALIPAMYALGRRIYSVETGLLAAALAAWHPQLVAFSSDARGYSLLQLFTLLAILLAHKLIQSNRWRDWALLSLCTALGFFTLPLMLYPAGGIYLWLALEGPKNRQFFLRWLGSGFLAGVLTLFAYAPALLVSGWRRIVANGFVQPVEAGKYFDWVLATRLRDTWLTWIGDVPLALTVLLILGFFLSLAFYRRIHAARWPLSLVLLVWVAALVLTRRPEAFDRFWSWLIAPALLWAAAGLVETAKKVHLGKFRADTLLTGFALAGIILQLTVTIPSIPQQWSKMGNQEAAAIFLAENWQAGDVALVGYPNEAQVWYYLARQGLPETAWQARADARRTWLLLATNQKDETLERVVKLHKLDPAAFGLPNARLAQVYGKIEIYLLAPHDE